MRIVAGIIGLILIFLILQDAFDTIILPRRVARRIRLTRLFYRVTWKFWSTIGRWIRSGDRRDYYLSYYGPLSLLLLLVVWAVSLIFGFATLQWALGSMLNAPEKTVHYTTDLYMSGTTFFTLGLGDVTPQSGIARFLTVIEAGTGFGFLALIIGYVPVIYQAFSRREVVISLLDAHAGSPPTAAELLRRHRQGENMAELVEHLHDWERWTAELLESHLSYPVLVYYRSQHEHQSWLATLTTILDSSALVMIGIDDVPAQAGEFAFAIARHAAVDLSQIFNTPPAKEQIERLPTEEFIRLRDYLANIGILFQDDAAAETRLAELRNMYEPYVIALANQLMLSLPPWIQSTETIDDWQTSAWEHGSKPSASPIRARH